MIDLSTYAGVCRQKRHYLGKASRTRLHFDCRRGIANMSLQFEGQTVIVTGVGHGFGRLYATYFASRGANMVVQDGQNPVRGRDYLN